MNQITLINTDFHIETDAYQGPFNLVLDLIEKRKLLVSDLSLATITDGFIEHVRKQDTFPVEETAYFIGIAATLILIKSKSLIPELVLTDEEFDDVKELKTRLELYEKIRNISKVLKDSFGNVVLVNRGYKQPEVIFTPSNDLTSDNVLNAVANMLFLRNDTKEKLSEVRVKPVISIEEMMETLAKRVRNSLSTSFNDFSGYGKEEKINVVVSFLALLELVKQGAVEVSQYDNFDDIHISNNTVSLPNYGI